MKSVLITGASGFVGRSILNELKSNGYNITVLIHKAMRKISDVNIIEGDILDYDGYADKVQGINIIINLIGIIKEEKRKGVTFENLHIKATENIIKLAKAKGINRVLQISANGAKFTELNGYQRTKYLSERLLEESGLNYTIIRSSSIFGSSDKFINMLIGIIKSSPVYPIFCNGSYQLAPVSVSDIAKLFRLAIDDERTYQKIFSIQGSKVYRYDELITLIAGAIRGKKIKFIHLPLLFVKFMILLKIIPITSVQLRMLLEGDLADRDNINDIFNIKLEEFERYIYEVGSILNEK